MRVVALHFILSKFTTGRKVSSDLALALLWPAFVRQRLGALGRSCDSHLNSVIYK